MKILYSDQRSILSGGPIRMVLLNNVWHVVGRGYLCRVEDLEEGIKVAVQLQAAQAGG